MSSPKGVARSRGWLAKFRCAVRGIGLGIRGPHDRLESSLQRSPRKNSQPNPWEAPNRQNSFWVHVPVGGAVLLAGIACGFGRLEMALLVVCVGSVIVAELLNTSIEYLARAVSDKHDERIGAALDVASGAVLAASLFAACAGACLFWRPFQLWLHS